MYITSKYFQLIIQKYTKSSFNVKAYVHVCLEKYDIRSFFFLKNVVIVSDPERGQVQAMKHLSADLQGRLHKLIGLL